MSDDCLIEIECEEPHYITCVCCQENITRLTRFVYHNNDAFAYYYAEIQPNSHGQNIKCLIVMCEFDENNEMINRVGFPLMLWDNQDHIATTLLNADKVSWKNIKDVEILNRENSLNHHYKADVFRIADEILEQDKEIMDFFANK
ncbi:hypothetical protein SAMN02745664_10944 [Moraxella cuniculi DSM 21768]|uniref:Uncharacterized protein n=1 Tax=Moraxella cuniculi DSM 21768 TaxID=1122245 RepID=A0A1N7F2D3_9GAMM|nr:hypothetical protein [Moraxella cuniculi]OOS05039.1 hypothetical protein B0189_07685 [Moraxella cuniculi]SIR94528.1 hypothetical protein SAMN02745664_10944 [Moraxella cuniculi DSM 21768]